MIIKKFPEKFSIYAVIGIESGFIFQGTDKNFTHLTYRCDCLGNYTDSPFRLYGDIFEYDPILNSNVSRSYNNERMLLNNDGTVNDNDHLMDNNQFGFSGGRSKNYACINPKSHRFDDNCYRFLSYNVVQSILKNTEANLHLVNLSNGNLISYHLPINPEIVAITLDEMTLFAANENQFVIMDI